MFGFFKKVFGSSEKRSDRSDSSAVIASEDLNRIEQELRRIGHGYEAARLHNRAGDLYLAKGERQNALKRYGDAIDAFLKSGEYDNAMAVCRKIIRVVPQVIRTRRTLAWLCLGKGFLDIAREHVDAYTYASREAGLETLALQQLMLMGQYVEDDDFRAFLAGKISELGDEEAATRVREGRASEGVKAAGWSAVIFAAMLTPEELRRAADEGVELRAPAGEVTGDNFDSLLIDLEPGSSKRLPGGDA
jgi:tetratricopeptide (TPR) repeat protein